MRTTSTICLPPEDYVMYRAIAKAMYLPFSLFIQKAIEKAYKKAIYEFKEKHKIDKVWEEETKPLETQEPEEKKDPETMIETGTDPIIKASETSTAPETEEE